jgi:putative aldouronate transport system permease protein
MVNALLKRKPRQKISGGQIVILALLVIITAVTVYPVLYVLSMSFSDVKHIILQDVSLLPKDLSIESYRLLFQSSDIWVAYKNTVVYTVGGTAIGLISVVPLSYAVSQKRF